MAPPGQAEPVSLDKGRTPPAPPPAGTAGLRRHVGTVGLFTMASRVLGLVREWLMAHFVGAGLASSAFYVAFAIPNFARRLFGEGALSSAFVPVFKGLAENGRMDAARRLARAVSTMAWLMLGAAVLLAMLAVSGALAFAPDMPERAAVTLRLLRVMLPYAVFICAAAFGMGVLNALGRFAAAAFAPCLLNLVWIGTLLAILFFPGLALFDRVRILSWAVLAAGALQMAFLLRCARRRGVPLVPSREGWRDEATRLVWRNTATAIVGAGAVQINAFLDQVLALYAAEWAPSAIAYADRLMELPLALFGTAFGTVLLPSFAGRFAKGDQDGARAALRQGIRDMMMLMLPSAAGLAVLAPDVTAALFEHGAFGPESTTRVARAVAAYAAGLAFFGLAKALAPWFHAQNDMKTPLRVSVRMVFANFALNLLSVLCLPVEWRHVGIAGATVVSSAASCAWLLALARKRNGPLGFAALLRPLARIALAAAAMGGVLLVAAPQVARLLPGETMKLRLLRIALEVPLGGAVYFAALALLLPDAAAAVRSRFARRRG
ncbi:MAG: murein biosynthesis integral membrane protein MurJ [Kiritimatiellae bacterium]|nr:murein biosynthesis integral membrane protein MurJ [Kiritimatiellia bacterium]